MNRIWHHPILGEDDRSAFVTIVVDGLSMQAAAHEPIAAALYANGVKIMRYTRKDHRPRGIFCAIGRCTDCMMTVDGVPNVRTCVTIVQEGMIIKTQQGEGEWKVDG